MIIYSDELRISYELINGEVAIVDANKRIAEAVIPESIDGNPVTSIRKKAFLGCKDLRMVSVPDTVRVIGEWAFAQCDNLARVVLRRGSIEFGKGAFKNDEQLKLIYVFDREEDITEVSSDEQMIARLLAATPVIMDAEYLMDTADAGSVEWIKKWDTRLEHVMSIRDDDGYRLYVLCGEEDLHFDYDEYMEYNREKKAALCMLRLVNDIALDGATRSKFSDYVLEHTKGKESEAAFKALLKRYGDEREYYELMLNIGAINDENLEAVLLDIGDRHAEMKAFLIESCGKEESNDFFDHLML